MVTKDEFRVKMLDFIEQAREIGRRCSDEAVYWSDNAFYACDLHNDYMIWRTTITHFLRNDCGLVADGEIFGMENAVPYLKGGIEYGNKNSQRSRALIKAIGTELNEKLRHINELLNRKQQKEQRKAISGNVTGYFYEGRMLWFDKNTIYYLVFVYLFEHPEERASYDEIDRHLSRSGRGTKEGKEAQSSRIRNAIKVYEKNPKCLHKIGELFVFEEIPRWGVKLNNPVIDN